MKKNKIALIFGVTGQDGAYLSRLLLKKGYIVHGVKRRSSLINTDRIDDIYEDIHEAKNFFLHYGDLIDGQSINQIIQQTRPTEIYNLAAQSHVAVSFKLSEYTMMTNALGTLKLLEAILNINPKIKYYQAGTSEMFGSSPPPQNENSPFYPRSPYAVSKLAAHWLTINYREAYNIFTCNGILFNHESPLRGETFVTKKIVKALVKIKFNKQKLMYLGNLYSKRDWGHAKDYVQAMWLMLQQKKPDDYVISTGKSYTIKHFINEVSKYLNMNISWSGKGLSEKGLYRKKTIIKINKKYFRPTEVESLKGNPIKALKKLNWKPKFDLNNLIKDMVDFEENRSLIEHDGYKFLKNYKDTSYNEIDIFSPCATGGDLNLEFINFNKSNKVNCVLGAANNQLANPNIEKQLFDMGIDYCPDYCVNAGGVIILALRSSLKEDMEYYDPQADKQLTAIKDQLKKILQLSKEKNQLSTISSNELAEEGFLI